MKRGSQLGVQSISQNPEPNTSKILFCNLILENVKYNFSVNNRLTEKGK